MPVFPPSRVTLVMQPAVPVSVDGHVASRVCLCPRDTQPSSSFWPHDDLHLAGPGCDLRASLSHRVLPVFALPITSWPWQPHKGSLHRAARGPRTSSEICPVWGSRRERARLIWKRAQEPLLGGLSVWHSYFCAKRVLSSDSIAPPSRRSRPKDQARHTTRREDLSPPGKVEVGRATRTQRTGGTNDLIGTS